MVEERTKYKAKNIGGMAVGVVSVAALIFAIRSCKPEPERIVDPRPPVTQTCPPAPVSGDGNCEIDKGEHDPLSPAFSAADCGFCGDGNILRDPRDSNPATNAIEIRSTDPRARAAQPAGSPRRIVCDFDWAAQCENPREDASRELGVLVRPAADGGVWSFGLARPTCTAPAPQPADSRRGTTRRGGSETGPRPAETAVVRPSGGPCPSEVAGPIRSAVARISNDPPGARTAAHVRDGEQTGSVQVSYSYTVTPPGNVSGSTRVSCAVCSGGSYPIDISRAVVSTNETCTVSGSFSVAVQ